MSCTDEFSDLQRAPTTNPAHLDLTSPATHRPQLITETRESARHTGNINASISRNNTYPIDSRRSASTGSPLPADPGLMAAISASGVEASCRRAVSGDGHGRTPRLTTAEAVGSVMPGHRSTSATYATSGSTTSTISPVITSIMPRLRMSTAPDSAWSEVRPSGAKAIVTNAMCAAVPGTIHPAP